MVRLPFFSYFLLLSPVPHGFIEKSSTYEFIEKSSICRRHQVSERNMQRVRETGRTGRVPVGDTSTKLHGALH